MTFRNKRCFLARLPPHSFSGGLLVNFGPPLHDTAPNARYLCILFPVCQPLRSNTLFAGPSNFVLALHRYAVDLLFFFSFSSCEILPGRPCFRKGVVVVRPGWVVESCREGRKLPCEPHFLPPFEGLRITATGLSPGEKAGPLYEAFFSLVSLHPCAFPPLLPFINIAV